MTGSARRREAGALPLLVAILRDTPSLPRAMCIGEYELVDAATDGDQDALRTLAWLCRRCPERVACQHSRGGTDG